MSSRLTLERCLIQHLSERLHALSMNAQITMTQPRGRPHMDSPFVGDEQELDIIDKPEDERPRSAIYVNGGVS